MKYSELFCYFAILLPISSSLAQSQGSNDSQNISGEISLGTGFLTDDSYRFGRHNGLVDEGFAPLFRLRLQTQPRWDTDDPRYAWFNVEYLGAESINARGEIGITGDQHAALEFRKLSNFLYRDTVTPFSGGSDLSLPANWQTGATTTQDFITLADEFNEHSLEQQRDRWSFSYKKLFNQSNPASRWNIHFDFRHETKKGHRALAGTIGTTGGNARSAILSVPMDFETNILELGLNKTTTNFNYGLSYQASYFSNDDEQITWDNPFGQVAQWANNVGFPDGGGQLALEPDNMAHSLRFNSAWYINNSSVHVDVSRGEMRQKQDFLPYTVNPSLIVDTVLPRNQLSGRVNTTNAALKVSTRLLPSLNINASYRLDDRDNRTPRDTYLPVSGDAENQVDQNDGRVNRPYSFTKQLWDLDFSYRLAKGLRLTTGLAREDTDRNFSEVNKTTENSYYLGLNIARFQPIGINLSLSTADRDSDIYIGNRPFLNTHVPGTVGADEFENHPLLRKYYLSDRERQQARLWADWFINERLNIGIGATHNRDDYDEGFFGLNDATMNNLSFDAAYQASADISVSGFFALDNYSSDQTGRSFTAVPATVADASRNWRVQGDDEYTTVGLTANWKALLRYFTWLNAIRPGRELDAGFELVYSRSRGELNNNTGTSLPSSPFPELSTRLVSYQFYVNYVLISDAHIKVAITHETYRSDDFALDNTDSLTIDNVLTLGERSQNYSLNWISLSYSLPF
jgi:MtrB/PioB family decaheme-associated outer membrane protein